jgi:hypothetical protein
MKAELGLQDKSRGVKMKSKLDPVEIIKQAVLAYHGNWASNGFYPEQPSIALSSFDGEIVTLKSAKKILARYRWIGAKLVPLAA